jgi:hypothetical protein
MDNQTGKSPAILSNIKNSGNNKIPGIKPGTDQGASTIPLF